MCLPSSGFRQPSTATDPRYDGSGPAAALPAVRRAIRQNRPAVNEAPERDAWRSGSIGTKPERTSASSTRTCRTSPERARAADREPGDAGHAPRERARRRDRGAPAERSRDARGQHRHASRDGHVRPRVRARRRLPADRERFPNLEHGINLPNAGILDDVLDWFADIAAHGPPGTFTFTGTPNFNPIQNVDAPTGASTAHFFARTVDAGGTESVRSRRPTWSSHSRATRSRRAFDDGAARAGQRRHPGMSDAGVLGERGAQGTGVCARQHPRRAPPDARSRGEGARARGARPPAENEDAPREGKAFARAGSPFGAPSQRGREAEALSRLRRVDRGHRGRLPRHSVAVAPRFGAHGDSATDGPHVAVTS